MLYDTLIRDYHAGRWTFVTYKDGVIGESEDVNDAHYFDYDQACYYGTKLAKRRQSNNVWLARLMCGELVYVINI